MPVQTALVLFLMRLRFYPAPPPCPDGAASAAFEALFATGVSKAHGGEVHYGLPYPRHEFLRYIAAHKDILLHGSNSPSIEQFIPQTQTDYSGRPMTGTFASGDSIWPLFFAVVQREGYRGSLRNGCFVVGRPGEIGRRFYFFSLNRDMLARGCFGEGTVYIVPRETFRPTGTAPIHFDEWASPAAVRPLARMPVSPQDFPFLPRVAGHSERELIFTSWLLYKLRTRRPRYWHPTERRSDPSSCGQP